MKITNKLELPSALYRALRNDPYSRGKADFSITELISPPRLIALKRKYEAELTEDASDRVWSLLGQAVHSIIERANVNDLAEKRFFYTFGDKIISGQIDTLDIANGIVTDFKVTTAWAFMAGRPPKEEWIQQLNIQAFLLQKHGHNVRALQIVGLLRDWQIRESKTKPGYPNTAVALHEVPLWHIAKTEAFIRERIVLHIWAQQELPQCTTYETWNGKRCASYCVASSHCTQYKGEHNVQSATP